MKSAILVIIQAALATAAASGGPCTVQGNPNGKVTCCDYAVPIIGQLLCTVAFVGDMCGKSQQVYCCKGDAVVSFACSLSRCPVLLLSLSGVM